MSSSSKFPLLDERGEPLSERIQRALKDLLPRFHQQFPRLRDEAVVSDVLEKAGQRIAARERRDGPVERLHGFAWVTLRNVTISRLRRSSHAVEQATIDSAQGETILSATPSEYGSAESMESGLAWDQALAALTDHERIIAIWKKAGYSSKEIAQHLGTSTASVDTAAFRARQKLRKLLGREQP